MSVTAVMTTWMAASRLYLSDHWPTDVVASIVLSWGVVAGVVRLDIWIQVRSGQQRWLDGGAANSVARLRRNGVPLAD